MCSRRNFFEKNYDFWSTRIAKSMNYKFLKRYMDLHLNLGLMAKFYSTFLICFVYPLFRT